MHDAPSVYSQPHSSDLSDSSSTNFQPVKKLQTPTISFHDGVVLAHDNSIELRKHALAGKAFE
ncbi:hypothetical protein SNOG_03642 [Parastagonospora nodorum SN15]|uniref:Uncharacterized protein n=1 Tax=Phaeosphaeria nodorum (strain SN15 / ATCC MYA-4574 / FGSC 10173) TaxID=321614 RepID=Q0UX72_PHANO|nr:hypothetical protein SNOG_03642 [Parastagonospora nodorum SN15]EAT88847.1 hypothetical protein SNOG_03642 [Parastagonospora nodorum SN15]